MFNSPVIEGFDLLVVVSLVPVLMFEDWMVTSLVELMFKLFPTSRLEEVTCVKSDVTKVFWLML